MEESPKVEIVGMYEASQILGGVSKQYIHQLVQEGKLNIYVQLKCGRIFLKSDVAKLQQKRESNRM